MNQHNSFCMTHLLLNPVAETTRVGYFRNALYFISMYSSWNTECSYCEIYHLPFSVLQRITSRKIDKFSFDVKTTLWNFQEHWWSGPPQIWWNLHQYFEKYFKESEGICLIPIFFHTGHIGGIWWIFSLKSWD